jgi:hypothetical protein
MDAVTSGKAAKNSIDRQQGVILADTGATKSRQIERIEPVETHMQQAFSPIDLLFTQAPAQAATANVYIAVDIQVKLLR